MAFNKKFLLGSTMIAGLAAAMMASTAAAQTPQTEAERAEAARRAAEAAAQQTAPAGTEVEELVVTGSRIRRNSEFNSANPIQVLTADSAALEGIASTSDILQTASVTGGAFEINNQLTGFVVTGGPGVNTVDLRGLGAQRTLTLINGRRAGPAGTRGQVGPFDLNVIPSSIIERVEILKDGASSVYGSDAVAGVVNFITRTNLDGAELTAFANASEDGGGEFYRLSGAFGRTFDRGYFNISGEYYHQEPLRAGDRDQTACAEDYQFDGSAGDGRPGARVDAIDPRTGRFACRGLFANVLRLASGDFRYLTTGETLAQFPAANGYSRIAGFDPTLLRQGRAGFPNTIGTGNYQDPLYLQRTVISPVDRYTLFATFGYDLTPNVELYAEALLNRRESEQFGVRQYFPTVVRFNSAQIQPNGTPLPTSQGNTFLPIIPLRSYGNQTVDYTRFVLGFRGRLPDNLGFLAGWDYDLYGQYSRSDATYSSDYIKADASAAVTNTAGPCGGIDLFTGAPVPNVSGYSCASIPNGINFLSPRVVAGQFTDAERAFLFGTDTGTTTYDHMYVEGTLSGDLFTLPAGAVGVAVGFQLRREEIDDSPGPATVANNIFASTVAGATRGSDSIREVFGELEVPLIRGVRGFQDLTLQLSGRYSDYDSYGSNETYKIGLNWQIFPLLRFRATYGTSFRAPALYEQFLGNQTGFLGQTQIDPCIQYELSSNPRIQANCAAAGVPLDYRALGSSSAVITTGGGRDILTAETSDAMTVGFILTPSFIDLSVALDYFDIQVNDEVAQFGSLNILTQCYQSANYPTNPFCSLFTRNGDPRSGNVTTPAGPNAVTAVNDSYVNVAAQHNRGLDLTVRYQRPFSFGNLRLDGQFTWIVQDTTSLLGSDDETDYLGSTYRFRGPDFVGNTQVRFERGDWTFAWSVDFMGKGSDTELFGTDRSTTTALSSTCNRTAVPAVLPAGVTNTALGTAPCNTFTDPATGAIVGTATVVPLTVYNRRVTEFTALHAFSVRRVFDQWTFTAGIRNIFDERSPSQSTGQFRVGTGAITPYNDFYLGRQGFISITRRF